MDRRRCGRPARAFEGGIRELVGGRHLHAQRRPRVEAVGPTCVRRMTPDGVSRRRLADPHRGVVRTQFREGFSVVVGPACWFVTTAEPWLIRMPTGSVRD
ncbi:hypothetical protein [Haloarcula sp. 1CSR25-25]|uniref:hypothetical protein n=1 Tax=Haloarcula sp. 1CSR25-25 TaxID=2862545 RepID=UPI00289DA39D|nr:hypothetical protein [Haloarcula sp. 1CSR25-25]